MTQVTIVPARTDLLSAVADLFLAQRQRQHALYPQHAQLWPPDSHMRIEGMLAERLNRDALVALDSNGRVRGYAQPSVWNIQEQSTLLSFLTSRNGIVQDLVLPEPTDEDAKVVVLALLHALDLSWRRAGTTGDLLRWPSADVWFGEALERLGFQLDSVCASRPIQPFFPQMMPAARPAQLTPVPQVPHRQVRIARSEDEDALVELFQAELRFHERYTPFVRSSPPAVEAFRRKIRRGWSGHSGHAALAGQAGQVGQTGQAEPLRAIFADGAPLVLVVEQDGAVVAMAENTLLTASLDDEPNEPGFTPPGRYWCIDNVSVREDLQRSGLGRLLVQAIEERFLPLIVGGYILWYNPTNPSAAHFWPRLGFQPLWTTYQRLHPNTVAPAGPVGKKEI